MAGGQSPPQELEVSPHSGLYLLGIIFSDTSMPRFSLTHQVDCLLDNSLRLVGQPDHTAVVSGGEGKCEMATPSVELSLTSVRFGVCCVQ